MAFGAMGANPSFGISAVSPPRFNLLRIEEELSQAHLRLSRAYIENLSWDKCIDRYDRPTTLFYCDPPYWGTTGYGNEFSFDQYGKMSEIAKSMKGKIIISVNDIPEMRSVFDGFTMNELKTTYTNSASKNHKPAQELLIRNF